MAINAEKCAVLVCSGGQVNKSNNLVLKFWPHREFHFDVLYVSLTQFILAGSRNKKNRPNSSDTSAITSLRLLPYIFSAITTVLALEIK